MKLSIPLVCSIVATVLIAADAMGKAIYGVSWLFGLALHCAIPVISAYTGTLTLTNTPVPAAPRA